MDGGREGDIIDLLGQVTSAVRGRLQYLPVLAELSLPAYPARLLALAAHHPGWSQQQFARATERDKAQVARAVKELEARGLVSRAAASNDARANGVLVTDQGQAVARRLIRERQALGETLLVSLDAAERDTMASVLDRLARDLLGD